ncbi:hypothetical protein B0H13DRAFT_2277135 [Mycena leptocephala]|nr:hypothetical protein B0H13DRAFT_2277135 [Mycena leptocephala]
MASSWRQFHVARITRMSQEMGDSLKQIFKTSSNGYAFMAIVVHHIGNDGQLGVLTLAITTEESLIDFCELIGQHSGENMTAAIWETVEMFGLLGRNSIDTENFSQLLEAIGVLTKEKEVVKSNSRGAVYQEAATESLRRAADDDAGETDDGADFGKESPESVIGCAVFKRVMTKFGGKIENNESGAISGERASGADSHHSFQRRIQRFPHVGLRWQYFRPSDGFSGVDDDLVGHRNRFPKTIRWGIKNVAEVLGRRIHKRTDMEVSHLQAIDIKNDNRAHARLLLPPHLLLPLLHLPRWERVTAEVKDNDALPTLDDLLEQASILRERYASQTAYEQSLDHAEHDEAGVRSKFPEGSTWTPPCAPEEPTSKPDADVNAVMPGHPVAINSDFPPYRTWRRVGVLMKALADVKALAGAEEDARLDDGAVEIASEDEYEALGTLKSAVKGLRANTAANNASNTEERVAEFPTANDSEPIENEDGPKTRQEPPGFSGDRVLSNSILFLMEFDWWIELNYAIPEGDVGRTFEILKAPQRDILWRGTFWSLNCPRHQARSFETLHSAGGGAVKTMLMYSEIFLLMVDNKRRHGVKKGYIVDRETRKREREEDSTGSSKQNKRLRRAAPINHIDQEENDDVDDQEGPAEEEEEEEDA